MQRLLTLIVVVTTLISCKKDNCSGDCAEIKISGQVVDTSSNRGIKNIPINIYWQRTGFFCIICPKTKIKGSRTNENGNFNFSANVDRRKFEDHLLFIEATIPDGYLHPYDKNAKVIDSYISRYASSANNLRITMYPKANLSIKLVRSQNDNYSLFDITYQYSPTRIGIFSKSGSLSDTTLNIETSANIYTKIEWTKGYGFGQATRFVDSIICSPNNNNTFTINY